MNIYAQAAHIIRERGWRQGASESKGGPLCIMEALGSVIEDNSFGEWRMECLRLFQAGNRLYHYLGGRGATTWNDTPGRTKEEVLAVLDELAAQEEPSAWTSADEEPVSYLPVEVT